MRLLVVVACVCGCVSSHSTVCDDGRVCPEQTICDPAHPLCIAPDQVTACDGLADGTSCTATAVTGHCLDGVCLESICGDGVLEDGELCDDGNTVAGDGCSASCSSNEACGNNLIDMIHGEQCDDGNHLDHDGCSSTCLIETPHWIEHSTAPPGRIWSTVAYDSHRDRLVMFGGVTTGPVVFDDTWEWGNGEWVHAATATAPGGRYGHSMAYDASIQKAVMFGGFNSQSMLGDTWTWDGVAWHVVEVAGATPRQGAAMAYDERRKRIVMFGGQVIQNISAIEVDDTWEWNGATSTWTKLSPTHVPPKRVFGSMSYDPVRGVVVLAGGQTGTAPSVIRSDTWTFDGTDWTDRTPAGAKPAVAMAGMAWDPVGQRTILFGGKLSDTTSSGASWAWDGSAWSVLAAGPTARTAVVLGQSSGRLVLFGGTNPPAAFTGLSETYLFTNSWARALDPGPREAPMMLDDPLHGQAVLFGGFTQRSPTNMQGGDTWTLTRQGLTHRADAPPVARSSACIAYDYARREIVMFGGATTSGVLGDTWIWSGAGWSPRTPAMSPPPRAFAACAFDGTHVTLMGGGNQNESSSVGDAWTWDGTTWSPVTTPFDLVPRTGAVAAYDPVRHQLVMFGGNYVGIAFLDQTWTYEGTTWTQVNQNGFRPSGRNDATLTWNAARQKLTLIGGNGSFNSPLDAFEWTGDTWTTVPSEQAPIGRWRHGAITSLDGAGVSIYGGSLPTTANPLLERWDLRWDAAQASEECTSVDLDGDGLIGCADPDCWPICAPACPPATTCDPSAVTCGDHVCDAVRENCHTCPSDCTCTPVCGDGVCDAGEAGCPGDCP